MSDSPIFILGNPRSGTTLVRLIISSHSKINIAPESEFIVKLFPKYGHIKCFTPPIVDNFICDIVGAKAIIDLEEQWQISFSDYIAKKSNLFGKSYAAICASIYKFYPHAKGLSGKTIWGDKNNAYGNYIPILTWMYPNAKFIHVVRDGRAVLSSYRKLQINVAQKYAPLLPKQIDEVANRWIDTTSRINKHLKKYAKDTFIEIRYEDVLTSFEKTITELCCFLNVQYENEMVQFYQNNIKHNLEPELFSWKKNTRKPLDKSKVDEWINNLSKKDVKIFESITSSQLDYYSYGLLYPQNNPLFSHKIKSILFRLRARIKEIARGIRTKINIYKNTHA